MPLYRASGLWVDSDIQLTGFMPQESGVRPDVTMHRGAVPDQIDDPQIVGPNWQIAESQLLLSVPGVARFWLRDGNVIVYDPGAHDLADVPIFLMGTAFGLLMHQRGRVLLHASAIRVGNKAVLFCGASGAGKSTLAAALHQRGYEFVSDDLCSLTLRADAVPLIDPDGRALKLWLQAIGQLGLGERQAGPVRPALGKYFVTPVRSFPEPLPLGALYGLREARARTEEAIATPNLVDAALLVRRNAYRPQIVHRMAQREAYLDAAIAIADHAGIHLLVRRMGFERIGATIDRLEAHWADLGLIDHARCAP